MYCQKPNIILRKDLHKILKPTYKPVYHDGNNLYPLHSYLISPKKVGATKDNYKNWSILTDEGELLPLFLAVPCGKCILCADKKAKAWSTRASCETASSVYPPLFITLTYEGSYLPINGLEKSDVQRFIKRFRENYIRMFGGKRLDLRYFAVGEYGSKYGRPHYHLEFWNVPNDKINESTLTQKAYQCLCRSWSEEVTKEVYDSIPEEVKFLKFEFEGKFYKLRGRVDMSVDRGNSAAYCMKYMFKEKVVPDEWQNPTFYLSSRRGGGIGMRYLNEVIESIRIQEPAKTTIQVRGVSKPVSLPKTFKDKLFPTLSMIIPSHIRNQLCRFDCCVKTAMLNHYPCEYVAKELYNSLRSMYGHVYDIIVDGNDFYHRKDKLINPHAIKSDIESVISICYSQCQEYDPDIEKIQFYLKLKDKRNEILQRLTFPEIDTDYEAYKIRTRLTIKKLKENF